MNAWFEGKVLAGFLSVEKRKIKKAKCSKLKLKNELGGKNLKKKKTDTEVKDASETFSMRSRLEPM